VSQPKRQKISFAKTEPSMNSRKHKYVQRDLLAIIQSASHEELFEFDLSGQGLTQIPDAIGRLTNLRSLDLRDNQLEELPEAIGDLVQQVNNYAT
jgi:Leucine-rich repeat (LRR) protein